MLGAETQPLWVEIAGFLRSSLPNLEECTIAGAGHLLQIQRAEPVARAMSEFLDRNSLSAPETARRHAEPVSAAPRAVEGIA